MSSKCCEPDDVVSTDVIALRTKAPGLSRMSADGTDGAASGSASRTTKSARGPAESRLSHVAIVGKPNSGKSLLFNRLTGLSQRVANFPGVTVEVKTGRVGDTLFMDFPGVYSLTPLTRDEEVAVARLAAELDRDSLSGILCLLDATRLERSLQLGLQVEAEARAKGKPLLFVATMIDELEKAGMTLDTSGLARDLGAHVVAVSGRKGTGLDTLRDKIAEMITAPAEFLPKGVPASDAQSMRATARKLGRQYGPKTDYVLKHQNRLDRFFLSSVTGWFSFVAIMLFLFQAIFTWAAPLMDGVEAIIGAIGAFTTARLPEGVVADFVADAIFAGFGSFLVFVPQIFVLSFIIGILEDSGYLARAAIICHRPLSWFGMSGRSFVPLLSGHACAIPAIFAARTIESPKRRLLTILAIPLMSCSARLPVYSLLIAALIPPIGIAGIFGLQGLVFFALYGFSLIVALIVSSVLSRTVYRKSSDAPFVIELPPYRMPHWLPLIRRSVEQAWAFIAKAGAVIFAVTVVVWVLGYFPNGSGQLSTSWLASIGQWIAPVFQPLGLDWQFGVAILASFVAREVFVGTLGTLHGIEAADEQISGFAAHLSASGLTLASGLALLAFYAIALQCASTLAVIRKETGSSTLPITLFAGYGILAWAVAWTVYHLVG